MGSLVIREVSLGPSRESNYGAVVKVVIPQCIHFIAALVRGTNEFHVLWFVLADDVNRSAFCSRARLSRNRSHNVVLARIKNLLCRIQPQAIEMKLVDPVTGVRGKKLPHRPAVLTIKVNGFAPFVLVPVRKIIR